MTVTLLLLIGGLAACGTKGQEGLTPAAPKAPAAMTTTTKPTRSTPPPPLTVDAVVDGRTVLMSNGTEVQVEGLAEPGLCWADAASEFATKTLVGKSVTINWSTMKAAAVTLPDGTDYAVLAVEKGAGRAKANAAAPILQAQNEAKQAAAGLWGPACGGLDVKPGT